MSSGKEFEYETELVRIAVERLLSDHAVDAEQRAAILELLRASYAVLSKSRRSTLRKAAELDIQRAPPGWLVEHLLHALGIAGLHRWASQRMPDEMASRGTSSSLRQWLAQPPLPTTSDLLKAGLRFGLGLATQEDDESAIDARLGRLLRGDTMPFTYSFDPRALPAGFDTDPTSEFRARLLAELTATVPKMKSSMENFVLGAMSLDGYLPQDEASRMRHVRDLRFESENTTKSLSGIETINRESYELIAVQIEVIRTPQNGSVADGTAYFEEVAFVARQLIANAIAVPIDANGLRERVTVALNAYVPGQSGGMLTLPSMTAQPGASADLNPDNIRAVAVVYASWNLEELKLFQVLDRVIEVFMNGQLPIGLDNGGRALAEYYFEDHDQRLSEAARRMTYTRVLGVPGGEVSREAPPNRAFQDLFLRFLASISEYDRQRRISDVVSGRRDDTLSQTGEQARKSCFEVASNATLFGWGGVWFIAQRLAKQIERALRILSVPEILAAYGVQGPFQVIERVCASDFGGAVPNIVRNRTMAEAGKSLLDILAANTPAWSGQSGRNLFNDPFDPVGPSGRPTPQPPADIPLDVQREMMRSVEHWLAVNGIKDEQRARLGQPEMSSPAPSIPNAARGGDAGFDQLRQMISAGQTPSLDQLKSMVPDMGAMARL
jgi:hypothetical protein